MDIYNRHIILEKYLGYNKSFYKGYFSIDKWENELLPLLGFKNTSDFLNWIFEEIHTLSGLDYRLTPCGSPYQMATIPLLLGFLKVNFQDCFAEELKIAIDAGRFPDIHSVDYPIKDERHAKVIINIRSIRKTILDQDLLSIFKKDKISLENTFEKLCENYYSHETWEEFFKTIPREKIILSIDIIMSLYIKNKSNSKKFMINGLYSILLKCNDSIANKNSCLEIDNELINLTDWILSRADDIYLPFNSTNYSAKSTKEYLYYLNIDNEINKTLQIEEKNINISKDRLNNLIIQLYEKIKETRELISAKQKPTTRIKELKHLIGLNPRDRLLRIINSDKSALYFPDIFYTGTVDIINTINSHEIEKLEEKLKYAKKGILKDLKNKLNEYKAS